jgi:hypothetical protein
LVVLVLKVAGAAGGFVLLVYALYRAVVAAKNAGRPGSVEQIVGIAVLFFGPVIAPTPPREAATESRKLRRKQDESGDPP